MPIRQSDSGLIIASRDAPLWADLPRTLAEARRPAGVSPHVHAIRERARLDAARLRAMLPVMAWADLDDLNTNDVLTESIWQKIVDNFAVLKTHIHDGTTGGGGTLTTGVVYASSTQTTVVSSTVETTLYSTTLAGGSLGTNKIVLGVMDFLFDHTPGGAQSFTLRLKYGSTTIASNAVLGAVQQTGQIGRALFALWGDGSTTSQEAQLKGNYIYSTTAAQNFASQGTATENSATNLTLALTVQLSLSSANLAFYSKQLVVYGPHG